MHDPLTLCFTIRSPFRQKLTVGRDGKPRYYRNPLIEIWHCDPCKRGHDDSCGWFKRAHHGDPEMLEKIRKAIESDFDRVFKFYDDDHDGTKERSGATPKSIHFMGYFCPNGDPNFSVHGIVINMFFDAIHEYFGHNWRKSRRWMRKHLCDILMFAENPTDSLCESIVGTFRSAGKWDREQALTSYASCIYGWILRAQQPWWRHPRWHIHHWSIRIPPWYKLKRIFQRCATCKKHFRWNDSVLHDAKGFHCGRCHCSNGMVKS